MCIGFSFIQLKWLLLHLSNSPFHPLKLAQRHISLLLYANEAVILLLAPIGLKRALWSFMHYCTKEELIINYTKAKIVTFSKCLKQRRWNLDRQPTKQVKICKYLRIVLQASGSRNTHLDYISHNGQKSASGIQIYHFFQRDSLSLP